MQFVPREHQESNQPLIAQIPTPFDVTFTCGSCLVISNPQDLLIYMK